MKILFLTYINPVAANSSAAVTLNRLLTELARQGRELKLFYSDGLDDYPAADDRMNRRLAAVKLTRIRALERQQPFVSLFRLPYLATLPDRSIVNHRTMTRTVLRDLHDSGPYDLMVSWSYRHSIHLAALEVAKKSEIPWVACLSDPWVDTGYEFEPFNLLEHLLNKRFEKAVMQRADAIVFTTQETLDAVMNRYEPAWKQKAFVHVTGYDPDLFPSRQERRHSKVVIKHVGTFYSGRSPHCLFRAVRTLADQNDPLMRHLELQFVGPNLDRIRTLREKYALPCETVVTRPSVPYLASLREMMDADVLVAVDAEKPGNIFLPSKLVDYAGTGNLLWSITTDGPSARFTRGCGGIVSDILDDACVTDDLRTIIRRCLDTGHDEFPGPAAHYHVADTTAALMAELQERLSLGDGHGR